MIEEALTAIKVLYDAAGGATLRAKNTGGQWLNEAKDDVTPPYTVVSWIASTAEDYMGGNYEIASIQFDVFSEADDGGMEAMKIADLLMALYNDATLTITDFTHLAMVREGTGATIFIDDVWQISITYSLWFI